MDEASKDEPPPWEEPPATGRTPAGNEHLVRPNPPTAAVEAKPHYISEELPPGFWDEDPIPPPQRHEPADWSDFQEEPSAHMPGGNSSTAAGNTSPGSDAHPDLLGIEAHPLFPELRALFPGRVIEKQACLTEDESETTEGDPQSAVQLGEDPTEQEFDEAN